jgi:hypothetical protein
MRLVQGVIAGLRGGGKRRQQHEYQDGEFAGDEITMG